MPEPIDGLSYLLARLQLLAERVAAAVGRRRTTDLSPNDQFRGLYVSEADVDRLLAGSFPEGPQAPTPEAAALLAYLDERADEAERHGEEIPLRRLAPAFGLDPTDVELLLIAMAPDLDPRFERLYGYLHDDVTRRRASTGLALELCGFGAGGPERRRLAPAGPLVSGALVLVEDPDRSFLTRSLRVPDRVTAHLLGDDAPDPAVARLLHDVVEAEPEDGQLLVRALSQGVPLIYVRDRTGSSGASYAAGGLRSLGRPAVTVDLARLSPDESPASVAAACAREARLTGGHLIAGPVDALAERGTPAVRAFAELPCPTLLWGSRGWDSHWSRQVPLVVPAPMPTLGQRERVWLEVLANGQSVDPGLARSMVHFRLTPEQVVRAATAARQQVHAQGRVLSSTDLQAGARGQNAAGLEQLARRVEPRVTWDDLVLPDGILRQLRDLTARARHRDRVLEDWGMGRNSSKGRGIAALFAGESGTGKTISAEVVAGDLGLSLYVIDLATVVDKYIGETEKNLGRIFEEADRVNGVLLFDEADAIFGKRSEVKDAHDRYANVEVAYLLQRMELFEGLAILTTNLRANVDEAFTRRLDVVVDFPMPDRTDRRRLWEHHLPRSVPRSEGIDFDFLAGAFKLSGGNIRNIALGAAFLAAEAERPVSMADLIRATEGEYRKLGHLCLEAEFGPYFPLLAGSQPP